MKRRVVTISFTELNAPGGVPRWNRDLHNVLRGNYELQHFCWKDFVTMKMVNPEMAVPEWEKARLLNKLLIWEGIVKEEDIIIADGFWLQGFEHFPRTVSVAHGIWSHLTKEEADAGKQPDMIFHHENQVRFRKRYLESGGKIVAVSDFIADQMKLQWGFDSIVINNAVDHSVWKVPPFKTKRDRPIIIHGVNDPSNSNKGYDHIQALKDADLGADILSLDEASSRLGLPNQKVLGQADLVVIPSGYEGNSYFCMESLACGVPIVAYSVGYPYRFWKNSAKGGTFMGDIGIVLDRNRRDPVLTLGGVELALNSELMGDPRKCSVPMDTFSFMWNDYLDGRFRD